MTYNIIKIINGNSRATFQGIQTYDHAFDILQSIADDAKRNKQKHKLGRWQLDINDNEIIYQIGEM